MKSGTQPTDLFREGDILVWLLASTPSQPAIHKAEEFSSLATAHSLGSANVTVAGDLAYVDLTLNRDIDALMVKVIFGLTPSAY